MQGWQKTSFIDYPGKIASVFFYGGCNFRCPFCHNGDLVLGKGEQQDLDELEVIEKISKKKHLYEAVVITGGEPTLVKDLEKTLILIKEKTGLPIKLDTNGTTPEIVEQLLSKKLVDYVAMDIKTSLAKYPTIFADNNDKDELVAKVTKTIELLKKQKKVDYEFRSTLYPPLFEDSDLEGIATLVKGAKNYILQQYNPRKTLEEGCSKEVFSTNKLNELQEYFSKFVKNCEIR